MKILMIFKLFQILIGYNHFSFKPDVFRFFNCENYKNNFIGTTKLPAIIKDIPPRFSVKGGIETNTYGVYFDFVSNGNIYLTGIPQRSFFEINMDVFQDDSNKTCYGCILNMNGKDGVYSKDFIEEEVVHYK